jgi:hypothetical protein
VSWEDLAKRLKVKCLNMCDKDVEVETHVSDVDDVFDRYIRNDPIFTVTSTTHADDVRLEIRKQQHHHMKCFIDVYGRSITTNSAMMLYIVKAKGIDNDIKQYGEFSQAVMTSDAKQCDADMAANQGVKMQA